MGVGLLSHTGEYRSIELPVYSLKSADVKIYVEERGRSLGLWAIREGLLRPRWPLGRCFPSLHRTGNTGTEYAFGSLLEELQERNLKSQGKVQLVNTRESPLAEDATAPGRGAHIFQKELKNIRAVSEKNHWSRKKKRACVFPVTFLLVISCQQDRCKITVLNKRTLLFSCLYSV